MPGVQLIEFQQDSRKNSSACFRTLKEGRQQALLLFMCNGISNPGFSDASGALAAQGMAGLEQLVRTVVDILRHRVEANLGAVAATRLLDLPSQHAVGHEEFVACQAAFVKKQAAALAIRWEPKPHPVQYHFWKGWQVWLLACQPVFFTVVQTEGCCAAQHVNRSLVTT